MKPEDYYDFYHTDMDYMDVDDRNEFGDEGELFPDEHFRDGGMDDRKVGETVDGVYNEVYQYGVPLQGEDDEELYN